MGRSPCCSEDGLNRGAWTAQEDQILTDYVNSHGIGRWRILPRKAGLKRCGKSCRLRWLNYLRPDIKRGNISDEEEELIIRMHKLLGNRWSLIAGRLPGRTDNEIKNYWNTSLVKKLQQNQSPSTTSKKRSSPKKAKNPARKRRADGKSPAIRATAMRCMDAMNPPPDEPVDDTSMASAGQKEEEAREITQEAVVRQDQSFQNGFLDDVNGGDLPDLRDSELQSLHGKLMTKEVENNNENNDIYNVDNDNWEFEETSYLFNQTMLEELMDDACLRPAEGLDTEMEPFCVFIDSDIGWL